MNTQPFDFLDSPPYANNYLQNQPYGMPANTGFVGPNNFGIAPHLLFPPAAAFRDPSQSKMPLFTIQPISSKTRVETQIAVILTLDSPPLGVTKIHLPIRTMAKSKLIAKPRPSPSSDTFELDVMPVCASALQMPGIGPRSFALARGEDMSQQKQSSSHNVNVAIDPKDGGPINICKGCFLREQRRANRRIEKEDSAEDIMWKQSEKDRIVIFNDAEVMDWKPLGTIKESGGRRNKNKKNGESGKELQAPAFEPASGMPYSSKAKQVRLQMRITCYCRHHSEDEGFQVIFTLKDSHGVCVAQAITTPILIMDDHKSSELQNEAPVPDFMNMPRLPDGPAYWATPPPSSNGGPPLQRFHSGQSYSTTELNTLTYHPNHPALHPPPAPAAPATPASLATPVIADVRPEPTSEVSPSGSGPTSELSASRGSEIHSPRPLQNLFDTNMNAQSQVLHAEALTQGLLPLTEQSPDQALNATSTLVWTPMVHRTIPKEGPISGGIEICIKGEGFYEGLDVLFAGAPASNTIVESSTVILCTVPPAYRAGDVAVTLRYHQPPEVQTAWFNYQDSTEQDLMSTALEMLYRRQTGQTSKSRDIALEIIGDVDQDSPNWAHSQHPCFLTGMDLETSIVRLVDDAESRAQPCAVSVYNHCGTSGQTMLHLSASLGFARLVSVMLRLGADPNCRDKNGLSPMHMACLHGHEAVVRMLHCTGGDATLRSLIGLAPIDMALTQRVYQIMRTIEYHRRSRSYGATPASCLSRTSSMPSVKSAAAMQSSGRSNIDDMEGSTNKAMPKAYSSRPATPAEAWARSRCSSMHFNIGDVDESTNKALLEAYSSRPATPAEVWARSRRNSIDAQQKGLLDDGVDTNTVSAAAAIAAWRDNLANQIQYFQQSVQRTMPNLQVPNLPPLPTLQTISALVPGINASAAPPSYDEIYASPSPADLRARDDAFADGTCAAMFDPPSDAPGEETTTKMDTPSAAPGEETTTKMDTPSAAPVEETTTKMDTPSAAPVEETTTKMDTPSAAPVEKTTTDRSSMMRAMAEARTEAEREQVRLAHARTVKKLSNDRKLFFIWIPLLIAVVFAMCKDWVPLVVDGVKAVMKIVQQRAIAA
ncbi:MAG: hypothetical protein Q9168_006563 [Polycauliona sp. 1 TL-2023]